MYSTRVRIDQEINKWMNAGINVLRHLSQQEFTCAVFRRALFATPLGVPYNEDGSITEFPIPGSSSDPNPLAMNEQDRYIRIILKPGRRLMLTLTWNGSQVKDCLSKVTAWRQLFSILVPSQNLWEKQHNVLKGSTVAYGEATNKTGYNYKWENIVTYHNTFNKDHEPGSLQGLLLELQSE